MPDINMPAPRVPFVDGRTGLMSREWFLFLSSLGNASSDGDKGDITVSANGATYQINVGVVGIAELGGDITSAGKALLDDASASEQRTTLAINAANTPYSVFNEADWGGAAPDDVAEALDRLGASGAVNKVSRSGDRMYGNLEIETSAEDAVFRLMADPSYEPIVEFWQEGVPRGSVNFNDPNQRMHFVVFDVTGGDEEVGITIEHNAGVVLKYDNVTSLETHEYGTETTGVHTQSAQTTTADNGASTQIDDYVDQVVCTHLASRASHEFVFPATPVNRQKLGICGGMADVTSVTLTPSGAETILGAITTLPAYGSAQWEYFTNDTSWHRIDCNIGGGSGLSHPQVLARTMGS